MIGIVDVEPGKTVAINVRKLRDQQTPDGLGKLLPLDLDGGQFQWLHRSGPKMVGRMRILSRSKAISTNMSCGWCSCNPRDIWFRLDPNTKSAQVGDVVQEKVYETNCDCGYNCYENPNPRAPGFYSWFSNNPFVASPIAAGQIKCWWPGTAVITADQWVTLYEPGVSECESGPCDEVCQEVCDGPCPRFADAFYDVSAPAPPPDFNLSAAQAIKDGQQGTFSVTITQGAAVGYEWSFTAPSGAGNNPNVSFTAPQSSQTNTNGHWFAKPNVACPTPADLPSYYDATYNVKAKVTFSNGANKTKSTSLTVNSFWSPAGFVDPNQAIISGVPAMASDGPNGTGTWRVVGIGTLTRVVPTQATIFVIPTSQFYNKTVQHEQVHLNQFVAGPGHLFGDLWDANVFFGQIVDVTGSSQSDLINNLGAALTNFLNSQGAIYQQRRNQAEIEAHAVSDPIAPQYVYQNCGQHGN